jgi:gluconokinase
MGTSIFLVMGVSGSGKSTIGKLFADSIGAPFYDGDDFHPASNVQKMAEGIPLTDDDRWPWLRAIRASIEAEIAAGKQAVYACSALKERYRHILLSQEVHLIYLQGSIDDIRHRMQQRSDHFMPVALLNSQFEALEEPQDAWNISILLPPSEIVAQLHAKLKAE